jgi:hypothetical protein
LHSTSTPMLAFVRYHCTCIYFLDLRVGLQHIWYAVGLSICQCSCECIHDEPFIMPADASLDKTPVEEMQLLAACRHPNIVRVLGSGGLGAGGQDNKQSFMVLEAMHCNLHHWLYSRKVGPSNRPCLGSILWVAREVACGLAYLHPTIIHRDLK